MQPLWHGRSIFESLRDDMSWSVNGNGRIQTIKHTSPRDGWASTGGAQPGRGEGDAHCRYDHGRSLLIITPTVLQNVRLHRRVSGGFCRLISRMIKLPSPKSITSKEGCRSEAGPSIGTLAGTDSVFRACCCICSPFFGGERRALTSRKERRLALS